MSDRIVTVLVTAIGGGGHGEQILKALRVAPHTRYRIIGGDASQLCPQFSMVDQPVIMPRANNPSYIEVILCLCEKFGVDAVFHGCEPELFALSDARHCFNGTGVLLPINPKSVIDTCADKQRTMEFLSKHGFGHPATQSLRERNDIDAVERFPVVVKPVCGGGSQDCFIAQTREELVLLWQYLLGTNKRFIVQEYVGTFEDEFTVGVLHDMDGNFINSIAIHRKLNNALTTRTVVRNRSERSELGEWLVISSGISHGEVGRFPEVTKPCERIAEVLGVCGSINFQVRLVNGAIVVFEITPRFSGTTSLRAMMGYNEPDVLIRKHIFGDNIAPRFGYREGWVLRSLTETVLPETSPPFWQTFVS